MSFAGMSAGSGLWSTSHRGRPLVLVAVGEWSLPEESLLKQLRAELRGLGAAMLVASRTALFWFRPDDELESFALDDAGISRARDALFSEFALELPNAGSLRLVLLDDSGRERWRTTSKATPELASTLLEALSHAGKAALSAEPSEAAVLDGQARIRFSRRESVVLCLAAALSAMLAEGCKSPSGKPAKKEVAPAVATHEREVMLRVNGAERRLKLEPRVSLLDALRERLGLTGTKKGCDHGQCGACTVLLEGRRVNACLTLAVMAEGKAITTIEGLANGTQLHPLQQAFVSEDALQCGYCTPGQIMSALGLLQEGYALEDDDVREHMSGNICRCGAYPNIVRAIQLVRKTGLPA